MKLMIGIPDIEYKWITENPQCYTSEIDNAIRNGTPLPKGHGRLIDADALYKEYVNEPEEFNGGHSLMALYRNAPTIIEADKEVGE